MRKQRSAPALAVRAVITLLAAAGGAVIGFAVTLAIVVAKARVGSYIFAMEDLVDIRWEIIPILIGSIAGFLLGWRHPNALDRATVWGFCAMLLGVGVGVLVGSIFWGEGEGQWAGAVIFGALGLAGGGIASLRPRRELDVHLSAGARGTLILLASAVFATIGLTNLVQIEPLELQPSDVVPVSEPADVDAVVFLLGDGGAAVAGRSPLLDALRADVEWWSQSLARDSAVSIVYLGDVVYPDGVRDRDHPGFESDSARLWDQIELIGGPHATTHETVGLFLTGNHDWGNFVGAAGLERVTHLSEQLDLARAAGYHVALLPAAGEPGPVARDLRRNVRLMFLDTHWFLQARSAPEREAFYRRVQAGLREAGDREVIFVAHHPYYSAGPHGIVIPGYHTGGVAYLLKQSGTLVQDLNSPVYEGFLAHMRAIFETNQKPPLVFAGGHDHSLQVLTGAGDFDPRFILVSGAGSKVSSIRMMPGLTWGASQPGYMMLVFRKDDGVDLFVVAGDKRYLECSGASAELAACMKAGRSAFQIVYSTSLLGASGQEMPLTLRSGRARSAPDHYRQPRT
jgi:hypothetical protein